MEGEKMLRMKIKGGWKNTKKKTKGKGKRCLSMCLASEPFALHLSP